ncbi:hypothetical protein HII31_05777 [Pseudocercospora fuligena]|uniref:Uncharacterized protein n=1 Tax=Pseudocercospora fuligena TaxID=685502 RepID=A0A8H6RL52_9PEZI|nr:hypothetical protein HII31_05777 [Pseudocercospora fuligena]
MLATRSSNRVRKTVPSPAKKPITSTPVSRTKPKIAKNGTESSIHVSIDQPPEAPRPAPAEPAVIAYPSLPQLVQPEPIHPPAASLNVVDDRPPSHPYLAPPREESPSRTTSGLFVSDLDINSLQPRSTPAFTPSPSLFATSGTPSPGPKVPSIFGQYPAPVPTIPRPPPNYAPSPALPRRLTSSPLGRRSPILRAISPAMNGVIFAEDRDLPQDIELAYFSGLVPSTNSNSAPKEFTLILVFHDHNLPPKKIEGIPVMFYTGLVRTLADWCVPWYKGEHLSSWDDEIMPSLRTDPEGFRARGGWERWLGRACGNVKIGRDGKNVPND